jgi:hypothetical protein
MNTYVGEWVRSEARKNFEDREVENTLWKNLVSRLTQECLHLATIASRSNSKRKNGPGSEYASYSSNIVIQKLKQNPNGVKCTNCNGISHNVNHCFAPNDGMAGLQDVFQNKTGQFAKTAKKSEGAPIVAVFSSAIKISHCDNLSINSSRPSDYSFASIKEVLTPEEFTCVMNTDLLTLLALGASSHIIKDTRCF